MSQIKEKKYYEDEEEIDLLELVHILLRYKFTILFSVILTTILLLIGGFFYNKTKLEYSANIITTPNYSQPINNIHLFNSVISIPNKENEYKIIEKNKEVIIHTFEQFKDTYIKYLKEQNIITQFNSDLTLSKLSIKLNEILSSKNFNENINQLQKIQNDLSIFLIYNENKSKEDLINELEILNNEATTLREVILNYKLQEKNISLPLNQNTINFLSEALNNFLSEALNSEEISYIHYRELLNKYLEISKQINLKTMNLKNYDNIKDKKLNLRDKINKINSIIKNYNDSLLLDIESNKEKIVVLSPIETINNGKPLYLYGVLGIILGGMFGIFLAFTFEFIKKYKNKYSN